MKKAWMVYVAILLVITLTACNKTVDCVEGFKQNDKDTKCIVDEKYNTFTLYNDLEVENLANLYGFEKTTLQTYQIGSEQGITYVKLEEFLNIAKYGLKSFSHSYQNGVFDFTISFDLSGDSEKAFGTNKLDFIMTFNEQTNIIYISDFLIFDYMGYYPSDGTGEFTGLYIRSFDINGEGKSTEIDLNEYGYNLIEEDTELYIPFSLANLFFSGINLEYYQMDEKLLIFNVYEDLFEVEELVELDNQEDLQMVNREANNYLALLFDYFYGIKEYKDIDYFSDYFDVYEIDESLSYQDFVTKIDKAILDLDDLHSRLVYAGKSYPDYTSRVQPGVGSKTDIYYEAKDKYGCYDREEDFTIHYQDGKVFVELNRFNSEISYVVNRLQDETKDSEIVFDLTCNPGGYVGSVMQLLSVLTREPMVYSTYMPQNDRYIYKTYDTPTEKAIDGKYTFYVSPVTYSAANLFISLVQDMEIGTVIGTNTSGGASPVHYGVIPGGVIIGYSSYKTIVDLDGMIIESGIEPDIEYSEIFDMNNLYEE